MRLVFFGSGAFGLPTLQHLAARHSVLAVVSQPDRPAGRGGNLTPTPVARWATANIPAASLLKPPKINELEIIERIRAVPADAWVVIAFGQKLSRSLLADRFAINLHASLLPRWRGAAPINAAILGGDSETGNTVITLADRMDAGQILGITRRRVDPLATAGELHDILAADGPDLVQDVLSRYAAGTLAPNPQDESLVTIAMKLSKADDHVDFSQKADFVRRQIHALTPWPGVTSAILPPGVTADSPQVRTTAPMQLKLRRVQAVPTLHRSDPGIFVDIPTGVIACGQNSSLRLLEVQSPGRSSMPWADFFHGAGRSIAPGSRLIPARELA